MSKSRVARSLTAVAVAHVSVRKTAPPNNRQKTVSEGASEDEEDDKDELIDVHCLSAGADKPVQMSEEAVAFIKTVFKSKLKNSGREV